MLHEFDQRLNILFPGDSPMRSRHFLFLGGLLLLVFSTEDLFAQNKSVNQKPIDVSFSDLGNGYRLVGRLRKPFGETVTVQGVVVDGPFKGFEGGPNIRVQRINGRATQEAIQIKLADYPVDYFGSAKGSDSARKSPKSKPLLKKGRTYEVEGYETGQFTGTPEGVLERLDFSIQTTGYYFQYQFKIFEGKEIGRIQFSPADFIGREALIEGLAETIDNQAYITADGWRLLVNDKNRWTKSFEGKTVESFGSYQKSKTEGSYTMEKGTVRLVKLKDQIGNTVSLRGTARSRNGEWWFNYRGTDMHVENMKTLPGWTPENHWRPMTITGVLEFSDTAHDLFKGSSYSKTHFTIRNASWKPIKALLSPER